MIARDVVLYAVGGGHGHAVRGAVLQRCLRALAPWSSTLLIVRRGGLPAGVEPGGPVHETDDGRMPDGLRGEILAVDTFPDGWLGRLPQDRQKSAFRRRVLIARSVRDGTEPLPGSDGFEAVGLPYSESWNEWRFPWPRATILGYLLRDWGGVRWRQAVTASLHVWDPGARLDRAGRQLCARAARRAGLSLSIRTGPPAPVAARKFFVVGAGYNSFYEALGQRVDCAFLPVRRRYDDQRRRAAAVGRAVSTPEALLAWLRDEPRPAAHPGLRGFGATPGPGVRSLFGLGQTAGAPAP